MHPIRNSVLLAPCLLWIVACGPGEWKGQAEVVPNPAAEGFDKENSDSIAIAIADEVMSAMGGRKTWDTTRYIAWNFFGARKLLWDKETGDIRIESLTDSMQILMNINSMEGKVRKDGVEITHADSLKKYLEQGRNIWRNDSYWLVMPFKLKDSGVTLTYVKEDTTKAGERSDVLELRFQNVGHTPENKYLVWVDKDDRLIKQFAYFKNASQDTPNFVMPWKNYRQYRNILLSGDRGERQLTEISVPESVPENIFTSFDAGLTR